MSTVVKPGAVVPIESARTARSQAWLARRYSERRKWASPSRYAFNATSDGVLMPAMSMGGISPGAFSRITPSVCIPSRSARASMLSGDPSTWACPNE